MEDPVNNNSVVLTEQLVLCEVIDDLGDASEHADVERSSQNSVDNTSGLDDVTDDLEIVSRHASHCENLVKSEGTSGVIKNMFWIVVSSILYVFDVATDLIVAFFHYVNVDYLYFGLTLFFSLIPSLVMSIISATWHWAEKHKNPDDKINKNVRNLFPPDSKRFFTFKMCLCGIFLLGPLPRYCEALYYGVRCIRFHAKANPLHPRNEAKEKEASTKMGQCYARMLHEEADAAFLTLYEGFTESAPQLALQLYILSTKKFDVEGNIISQVIIPVGSVVFSFISVSWTLTNYDRKLAFMKGNTEIACQNRPSQFSLLQGLHYMSIIKMLKELPLKTSLLLFLANLFWTVSRFITYVVLVSYASVYGWIIWVIYPIHFLVVAFWHWRKEYNLTYSSVLSFIHVFAYLHPLDINRSIVKSRHPRIKPSVYYIVCLIENSILMGMWGYSFNCLEDGCLPWCYAAWIGHYLAFTFSVILFEIFYNRNIRYYGMGTICCKS